MIQADDTNDHYSILNYRHKGVITLQRKALDILHIALYSQLAILASKHAAIQLYLPTNKKNESFTH